MLTYTLVRAAGDRKSFSDSFRLILSWLHWRGRAHMEIHAQDKEVIKNTTAWFQSRACLPACLPCTASSGDQAKLQLHGALARLLAGVKNSSGAVAYFLKNYYFCTWWGKSRSHTWMSNRKEIRPLTGRTCIKMTFYNSCLAFCLVLQKTVIDTKKMT